MGGRTPVLLGEVPPKRNSRNEFGWVITVKAYGTRAGLVGETIKHLPF